LYQKDLYGTGLLLLKYLVNTFYMVNFNFIYKCKLTKEYL